MKLKHLFIPVLVAFFVLRSMETFAEPAAFTIDLLATYDYPGVGNSTTGAGINERGEIAGFYTDSTLLPRGFVRLRNGDFRPPIVEPNGTSTSAWSVNLARTVSGFFVNPDDNAIHGFLLSGNVFTQFDVAGAVSTTLHTINDAGDFVGAFTDAAQFSQAFLNIGGSTTVIAIPGALFNTAEGINGADDVVGFYTDSASVTHAFFRNAAGILQFPIDFPGAISTVLEAINDRG
jgi:uncharacterized membrane protein